MIKASTLDAKPMTAQTFNGGRPGDFTGERRRFAMNSNTIAHESVSREQARSDKNFMELNKFYQGKRDGS